MSAGLWREEPKMECKIEGDEIVIRVKIDCLQIAWENGPFVESNYGPDDEDNKPPVITDCEAFAQELVNELNFEDESGTNAVMTMFDNAMERAIENGADGVDTEND